MKTFSSKATAASHPSGCLATAHYASVATWTYYEIFRHRITTENEMKWTRAQASLRHSHNPSREGQVEDFSSNRSFAHRSYLSNDHVIVGPIVLPLISSSRTGPSLINFASRMEAVCHSLWLLSSRPASEDVSQLSS